LLIPPADIIEIIVNTILFLEFLIISALLFSKRKFIMHLLVYSFNKVEKQSLTLFAGDLLLEANILVLSKLLAHHFN
jgi:hypothetical protein